jgi:hypothetical protein
MSSDINGLPFETMTPDEIETVRVESLKELNAAEHAAALVKEESQLIAKQILELRVKKSDLDIAHEKARYNVKRLQSDVAILTSKFWSSKNK